MVSFVRMPPRRLKQGLYRIVGSRGYRYLHGAFFLSRLLLALAVPAYRVSFFGRDMLALADRIRPGDTVLDIGAYLGGTAVLFAGKVGPTGLVIAFEPFHHSFLSFLVKLLRLPVRVVPIALGADSGATELVVPVHAGVPLYSQAGFAASYDTAALAREGDYEFQRLEIRRDSLDGYLAREGLASKPVSAVKIDVEGAELDVLRGGERFFSGFRGPLVCEFWFNELPPKGWQWLRERRYACRKQDREGRWIQADSSEALAKLAQGETYGNFWWERSPSADS